MLWAPYSSTYSLWIIVLMSLIQYIFIASVFFPQNERKNTLVIYDCMNNWKIHLSFDIGRTIEKYSCIWYRHQWLHAYIQWACLSAIRIFSDQSHSDVFCQYFDQSYETSDKTKHSFLFKPIIIVVNIRRIIPTYTSELIVKTNIYSPLHTVWFILETYKQYL